MNFFRGLVIALGLSLPIWIIAYVAWTWLTAPV